MAEGKIENIIAKTFIDIADGLDSGYFGKKPKIAVTGIGSEHGEENALEAARIANGKGVDVVYIGSFEVKDIECRVVEDEKAGIECMEALLANGEIDGVVTMHYPFPIGVSTVGRIVTPGKGRTMYIATTTGTSATNRVEALVKNAIYGIIAAKACGLKNPSVGILNIDGARQAEGILKKLQQNGYEFRMATSARTDGGCVMRGNDLLTGSCDIMVTDSLTGNLLMKMFSAFTTGGSYESVGSGYGPGIGEDHKKLIMIVSRASGAPVVAEAICYAAELVRGQYSEVAKNEFIKANKAELKQLLAAYRESSGSKSASEASSAAVPQIPKEVVTNAIAGIEIMDIEDAVTDLLRAKIYAESGMGCTGPVILVSDQNKEAAERILREQKWLAS